jgi:hypothetical protein
MGMVFVSSSNYNMIFEKKRCLKPKLGLIETSKVQEFRVSVSLEINCNVKFGKI